MRFDFKDLELFVAVAEAGSIARAAERCHTVASAVSKRLSDLEESFGTPLLTRGARGVELTSAGHAFLVKARKLLDQAAQLDEEIEKHSTGMRGQVRVFANMSAIVEFLPTVLASFLQQHPDVHVHLEQHISEQIAAAVKENVADLGIVGRNILAERAKGDAVPTEVMALGFGRCDLKIAAPWKWRHASSSPTPSAISSPLAPRSKPTASSKSIRFCAAKPS